MCRVTMINRRKLTGTRKNHSKEFSGINTTVPVDTTAKLNCVKKDNATYLCQPLVLAIDNIAKQMQTK